MPELPEVEISCRGIAPHLIGQRIKTVIVRQPKLRWPVPYDLARHLSGQKVADVQRRAKYILIKTQKGTLLIHLGMSGHLRILPKQTPLSKHDHFDLVMHSNDCLRFNDPRRFGAILWLTKDIYLHPLLAKLGPEPLSTEFCPNGLSKSARGRTLAIKNFIMDGKVVVGMGNIYANEALFMAGIRPDKPAGCLSKACYEKLVLAIKQVLVQAIQQGGTTLKDFYSSEGKPGYFKQQLAVYGRAGLPCVKCAKTLTSLKIGQRSSVFCTQCQT